MPSSPRDAPPDFASNAAIWKTANAEAFTPLVDAAPYFAVLRSALLKAQRRICIVAWEFHSQTELLHQEADDGYPTEIGPLLNALLEEREDLEAYLLVWDYALIYLQEREWKIFSNWLNNPHPRLHFVSDETAPTGASHHQKIVTIDDSIAFCGGTDVSISRWDRIEHRFEDPDRVNPDGKPYMPYHDIHAAMTGEVVDALQEVVSERWLHATGSNLSALPKDQRHDIWPEDLDKRFENVPLSLSKTEASPLDSPSQIHQLHLDLFAAAKSFIYIENQYFSSESLCVALAERLKEKDGPEIILVLPLDTSGWLVESTVGLLRDRLLERLKEADTYDRLRVYYPLTQGERDKSQAIYVHAKLIVVDDRILKIGSSNLSNRSMSVDSEIDFSLAFEKTNDSIASFRQTLIAQHFSAEPKAWQEAEEKEASLASCFDAFSRKSGQRNLQPLSYGCDSQLKRSLADTQLLDPEDPIDPEFLIQKNLDKQERSRTWKNVLTLFVSLSCAALLGLGIYWAWGSYFGKEEAIAFTESLSESPWAPLIAFCLFTFGGTAGIPLNAMLITVAVVMGSRFAITYGVSGAIVSSCIGFALGHALGKPLIRKLGSGAVDAVSRKLGERSFRSVAFVRLLPIAPFFMVNMVAGASHLKFKEYLIGTILGMAPGMCMVVLLANRIEATARNPSWGTTLSLLLVVGILVLGMSYLRKSLGANREQSPPSHA
ncbi:VTT domain-containing protein [Pelagicoccus sp. SDUM812003]|uniref:VTT domain-containing protein n=1 Tax=Pelagicoccus sp. SDUM812003 TaxID=3041267 RepID=UPI00280C78FC|nr:VTT domain-containing protein [Pelagicoccus sp. SDUM812003]MDQ8205528.1 VTT domain-containing protein [Pelagicoccus sp. SDUM812003]